MPASASPRRRPRSKPWPDARRQERQRVAGARAVSLRTRANASGALGGAAVDDGDVVLEVRVRGELVTGLVAGLEEVAQLRVERLEVAELGILVAHLVED